MQEHKFIFVCGLNRSGTSILQKIISSADNASGFANTGVLEDEGQHLQSVYPQAKHYGGAGKFVFDSRAYLDHNSQLITEENKMKLLVEWSEHWDLKKPILVEKSPTNIVIMRFLQAMFPNSYFIIIRRHPIVVSYATQKWSKTSLDELLRHWIKAYGLAMDDYIHLNNKLSISYESLVKHPEKVLSQINDFTGAQIRYEGQLLNKNGEYIKRWLNRPNYRILSNRRKKKVILNHEKKINSFGYSLIDLKKCPNIEELKGKT